MEEKIKWDYEAFEYYEGRILQIILVKLFGQEQAEIIHKQILGEIKEHQGKVNFADKLMGMIEGD